MHLSRIAESEGLIPAKTAADPGGLGRREVAIGYFWNALFSIVGKALFPILQIFFYRRLGPEQIGIYAVLIPIYMISETLRDAGLALTYIADRDADSHREGQYAALAIINAGTFAVLIMLARGPIARAFHLPQLEWGLQMVALAIVLTGFSTIPANKLQKKARFRDAGLADFSSTLLSFIVAFALVLRGFGFEALVWQFITKSVFYAMACWSLEPVRIRVVRKEVLSAIWKRSSHNLLNNLLFTVYTVADNLMITKLFGIKAGGNYNSAYTFGTKPLEFFTLPLARTLLVAYTRKNDDRAALSNIFTRTIAVSVLVMLPLYVLVALFAKPLVLVVLGSKYVGAIPLLSLLAIYCGCRAVGSLCGNVLVAMNKPVYNVYGWLGAYCAVGAILWANWSSLTLVTVVAALTVGAAVVYITNATAAFWLLRPDVANQRKLRRAGCIAAAASFLVWIGSNLPFDARVSLLIVVLLVPPLYLMGIASIYCGSPGIAFSKRGMKLLWKAL
jgi:O-antigen/teichoic acid export membrane protein